MKDILVFTPTSQSYLQQGADKFMDSAAIAFENYPLFNYIFGNNSQAKDIKIILSSSLKASSKNWIGMSSGGSHISLALFYPPNQRIKTFPFLYYGGWGLLPNNHFKALHRLAKYENNALKIRERYSDSNCWYLQTFIVHPNYQNKGYASKTIIPMLNFFDATHQSCFVETNKVTNVQMYEHYGFKLVETCNIPDTNIPHYAMVRNPIGL